MSASSATSSEPAERGRGFGKVLLIILGSLGALVAMAPFVAGVGLVWAHAVERDADGFFTSRAERIATDTYALTHEGVELRQTPDWIVERLGTLRLRATDAEGEALFVGIGSQGDVDRYLRGVAHAEVVELRYDPPYSVETQGRPGGAPAGAPGAETFWVASATGPGMQSVSWEVASGEWAFVVMNADGSGAVAADVELGAKVDWMLPVGIVLTAAALLLGLGSGAMIFFGMRSTSGGGHAGVPAASGETGREASTYPVALDARLDEPLSRWLWLVKWFLAIPHFFVLAFLWTAFVVLTVVALFAILVSARYPRSIFEFNVGVLRWTWRVSYYAVSGIGTDRYPPFSLGPEPDYPATLDVPYPERLSRGLVLVKSWLLAIPHLIVVALFTGSVAWPFPGGGQVEWPGLIGLLTFVAGVVLLFRGRYPKDLHELIVGLNRWVYRVIAYVALMRDEYPPFTLGDRRQAGESPSGSSIPSASA